MDSDIKKLGGHAMVRTIIRHVRDYARNTTTENHLKLMGLGSPQAGSRLLPSAIKGVQRICKEHPKTAIAVDALLALYMRSNQDKKKYQRH